VVVCLAEDHFLLHTTSGGAVAVHEHLEEWLQCDGTAVEALVTDVTAAWATFMLSGPAARDILRRLPSDLELDAAAFAHMHYRAGRLAGVPCRVLRASFTGELSFEISVPAGYGRATWDALLAAGRESGLLPVGIEALMVLRTEKGYPHVGTDTDGTTTAPDLGWGAVITRQAGDFVGRRSLDLPAARDPGRRQFTGLATVDPAARLQAGAHLLTADGSASAGYVTSACYSPTLGRTVALGLVAGARERQGEVVKAWYAGEEVAVRLVAPGFYDPAGERLYD
ncbi:MAG TPA: aminomethyltransferase family protein, partial [Pseudohaliea sp.]|nr:aminomethyltransferase family protein [Pseudohaliea sp.]